MNALDAGAIPGKFIEVCNGHVAVGQIFLRVLCPLPFHHCSTRCSYQKDKRSKPANFPESSALSEIGERWIEKCFHVVFREFSCTRTANVM